MCNESSGAISFDIVDHVLPIVANRPVPRFQVLGGNTFLRGQDVCFCYVFPQIFRGMTTFWGGTAHEYPHGYGPGCGCSNLNFDSVDIRAITPRIPSSETKMTKQQAARTQRI